MIERIKNIQQYGKTARGKNELLKHLSGQRLTLKQAVLAHCYDCMGFYADRKQDCKMPHCSLHPFMPYNQNRVKRTIKKTMPGNDVEMRAVRL
jgi:hypothetical protein